MSKAIAKLAENDIVAPTMIELREVVASCKQPICLPCESQPAYTRVKNYSQERLRNIFESKNEQGLEQPGNMIGLSQATYDPDHEGEEDSDDGHGSQDDPSCRLLFPTRDEAEARYEQLESDWESLKAVYRSAGAAGRDSINRSMSLLLSQARANLGLGNALPPPVGTIQPLNPQRHRKRARTMNTHHDYYK